MKLEWRPVAPGDGPAISTSLTADEAGKLSTLAAEKRDVLEVGSAYGFSAVVMALAGAHVVAVDPHVWLRSYEPMAANLRAYGVEDRVTVIMAGAEKALPTLAGHPRRFGLVWIDGDHERSAVERDVSLALPLLAPGGVFACHDWGEDTCPGVREALEARLGEPHELVDTLAIYRGLS